MSAWMARRKQASLPDQVFLAQKFIQGPGAHPVRQRRFAFGVCAKKIHVVSLSFITPNNKTIITNKF